MFEHFDELMDSLAHALLDPGGYGSNDEIYERDVQNMLSDPILSVLHDPEVSNQTELYCHLA